MIHKALKITRKFYVYQKERFPVVVLVLSLFPAILSSSAVTSSHPTILNICVIILASVVYLLHIRIIDEHRDFHHDNIHHSTRPIQKGVILREELYYIDLLAVTILFVIAVCSGLFTFIISLLMLLYTYLAGKEFFIGDKIRKHFFWYNAVNLVQMFLMQIFVYTYFINSFSFNKPIIIHFIFTTIGTIIYEFLRKLKIPGNDGSGGDTYTSYLGFNISIVLYQVLLLLNAVFFFWITALITSEINYLLYFALGFTVLTFLSAILHFIKKTTKTDQLMQASFLFLYGFFNIAIYIILK